MKISNSSFQSILRVLCLVTAMTLVMGLVSSCVPVATVEPTPIPEAWNQSMRQIPLPRTGCFEAIYPNTEWREVECVSPPSYPMPPRHGPQPLVVGSGNDISAQVPTTGFISQAIGSFDSVSNVTSESSSIGNSGSPVANAYTLQLNTNFFASTTCSGSPNTNCQGWEQFVFENPGSGGARAFIQYWLLQYNTICPSGWNQFSFDMDTDIYCWRNDSNGAVSIPAQPITNLGNLILTGTANSTGDSIAVSTGTNVYSVNGDNSVNAAAGWNIAEFNVFGDGGNSAGASQATFNSGATIVPRTRIVYGGTAAPNCTALGFTGETNNLSFGLTAPGGSPPGPAVIFTENTAGGATSNCAAATTVGDTHLETFGGLLYDFQASGDFVLAQVDQDFVVQARQVSGTPTWPDASVNSAVATQMGKTRVAICLTPTPLNIDGNPTELGDGKSLSLPDGVNIWRIGNVYVIKDQSGNSVRAKVNETWINVSVGLGRWPVEVHGLLANAKGDVNQIETRDGTVLTTPFSFDNLYHSYADSWRVPAKESLLSVCGDEEVEHGIPKKPFYATDLDQAVYERTRAICTAAGVKEGPLLDACTLDVAVIGNEEAAEVFIDVPDPIAVGIVE